MKFNVIAILKRGEKVCDHAMEQWNQTEDPDINPHTYKPILLKFFYKIETEGTVPNLFYKAIATFIPTPHKYPQRNSYRTVSLMNKILTN